MILAHPQLDTVLEFGDVCIGAYVIEEPAFYRKILLDIYTQCNGYPGELVLSESDSALPFTKWVEVVDNCLCLDLNKKSLITKICAKLEKIAVSEGFYLETATILSDLERYMEALSFELVCDVECEKCNVTGLIKAMGVRIRDTYEDPLEKLLDYMELVREFDADKLFVLVGLRGMFTDVQLNVFLQSALDRSYRILLLDCIAREKLYRENRLTIDKDLCEF